MNKPSYQDVLLALCQRDPELLSRRDGAVNHNELARRLQAHQPTVSRHLNGDVERPSRKMGEKMCAYFRVTLDQLCGEAEIPGLFPHRSYHYTRTAERLSPGDDKIEERFLLDHLNDNAKLRAVESLSEGLSAKDAVKLAQYFLARAEAAL